MASTNQWDPEKILQLYLHDYMKKRGMDTAAAIFREEADIGNSPVVIDSPDGFLHEWWSLFYDVFASRSLNHQETGPEASNQVLRLTDNERKNLPPRIPQQFQITSNINKTMEQQAACEIPSKVYENEYLQLLNNANKLKFLAESSSNHPQQNIMKQVQDQLFWEFGVRMGGDIPIDPLDLSQRAIRPPDGQRETKANEGLNLVPLNGCPLNKQVLTSLLQAQNYQQQLQVLQSQNQQSLLAQALARTSKSQTSIRPGNSSISNSQDLRIPLTESELSKKDGRKDVIVAADDRPVGENIESYLSNVNDHADPRAVPFSDPKRVSATSDIIQRAEFSFEEIGCLHSSKNKVLSCHFSSDGKILASAGHEKKVFLWNMETFECVTTSDAHSLLITDVGFKPGSTIFATSSFDKTLKIWDATKPKKSLFELVGHAEQVMSLDFHPRKLDLLCSCDRNDIIRMWNVNQRVCMRITKGGSKQVRFQPRFAKYLATTTGNSVNVIDIETNRLIYKLKGHVEDVISICWDVRGNYIASVSEDSARVWCIMSGGKCVQELHSNGNKFQSCIFHPVHPNLLIIGGYQSLMFWIPTESTKTWTLAGHKGLIAGLGASPQSQMVASASHDHCVKLWK